MEKYAGWSGEWAFYLSNGSIERRKALRSATEKDVRKQFPFESWYPHKIKIVKLVRCEEEKEKDICPKNRHTHHLTEYRRECDFCGEILWKDMTNKN